MDVWVQANGQLLSSSLSLSDMGPIPGTSSELSLSSESYTVSTTMDGGGCCRCSAIVFWSRGPENESAAQMVVSQMLVDCLLGSHWRGEVKVVCHPLVVGREAGGWI